MPNGSKYWCWTLNNPTPTEIEHIEKIIRDIQQHSSEFTYLVYGKETSASGTPHLQGYSEGKTRRSLVGIKRSLGRNIHAEQRRGTGLEAANYCKKDGDFVEAGELVSYSKLCLRWQAAFDMYKDNPDIYPYLHGFKQVVSEQGRRKDLDIIKQKILDGSSEKEISIEFFNQYLQYGRQFNRFRELHAPERTWPMEVYVLFGPTGTGKSRLFYECYSMDKIFALSDRSLKWWDFYAGQENVVIDDFAGCKSCPDIGVLLLLLDRYPLSNQCKGGFLKFNSKRIFFTSNLHPHDWYPDSLYDLQHIDALKRRFTEIHYISTPIDFSNTEELKQFRFYRDSHPDVRTEQVHFDGVLGDGHGDQA